MNDMTMMTTTQPRPVRRIRPKPQPLLLLPEWRVTSAAEAAALARAGRLRALAKVQRRKAAFQPVEVVYRNPDFQARVEALAGRRG